MKIKRKGIFGITLFLLLLFLILSSSTALDRKTVITYPRFQSEQDTRYNDIIEILKGALDRTVPEDGPYTMKPSDIIMSELRAIQEVKSAESPTNINLIYQSTSVEMEKTLLPIRIPLRKGLLGYRVFLIRDHDKEKFASIHTIDELKKLSIGQGGDWGDIKVFKSNGFKVITGWSYEGLFSMLAFGRFDYFSRGINEAYDEYEERKEKYPTLRVEESILLYYPWPYYFFVSKNNPELARRIEKGLNMMIRDGTFDAIFFKYHQKSILKANIGKRKLFSISNPLLPPETPLDNSKLWYIPGFPDNTATTPK